MILPIVLTGRLGLPGGGVPNFALDPNTGEVIGGEYWPQGASGVDPATGEPMTSEGASSYTNDPSLWTGSDGGSDPNVLNTAPLWNTRGTQWHRRGSAQSESGFDRWRRAGKPTSCSLGDYTLPDGTPCDPGFAGTVCQDSTQRILQAIAAGANAAAGTQQRFPGQPYYPGYTPGGTVTVSGGASPGAWLFGGLIVVGLIYAVSRR